MHTGHICRYLLGITTSIVMAGFIAGAHAQTYFPSDVNTSSCNLTKDEFETWTTLDLSTLEGTIPVPKSYDKTSGLVYVFPTNGPNFIDDKSAVPANCDFYKWGAQMFLWLTSTIDDTLEKPKPTGDFPESLPYVFNSEFFYRVSEDKTKLLPQGDSSSSAPATISLRRSKTDEETTGQAGGSGVLLTQTESPITNGQSLTYYGIHVNRTYGYFLNAQKTGAISTTQFPSTAKETCEAIGNALLEGHANEGILSWFLYLSTCAPALDSPSAASHSPPTNRSDTNIIPHIETAVDFLSMTMELKTSWVDVSVLTDPGKYIRQKMWVPTYDKSKPDHWKETGSEEKVLALVGMHVVGTVEGHPENIWVTIEHVNNAPNSMYHYKDSTGEIRSASDSGRTNWLYSDGTQVTSITELAQACTEHMVNIGIGNERCLGEKPGDIVSSASAKPIGASNVTRLNPWGSVQSSGTASVVDQNTQLIALNNDVKTRLQEVLAGDARQNYFVSGAVWTSDGSIPTSGEFPSITGTTTLANTTMETFHQDIGCFTCHSVEPQQDGLGVSHIYEGINLTLPSPNE